MTNIRDMFQKQSKHLTDNNIEPCKVLFSERGFLIISSRFDGEAANLFDIYAKTYFGLPYEVDPGQLELVKVVGADWKARTHFRGGASSGGISITVDSIKDLQSGKGLIVLAGERLSKAQMCDLIRAYLESVPDDERGTFEAYIDRAVRIDGRFE